MVVYAWVNRNHAGAIYDHPVIFTVVFHVDMLGVIVHVFSSTGTTMIHVSVCAFLYSDNCDCVVLCTNVLYPESKESWLDFKTAYQFRTLFWKSPELTDHERLDASDHENWLRSESNDATSASHASTSENNLWNSLHVMHLL